MKKITGLMIAGAIAGLGLSSCGEKYTPLTEEQKTAKADSIFAATAEAKKTELEARYSGEFQARVDAKVAELEAATTSK